MDFRTGKMNNGVSEDDRTSFSEECQRQREEVDQIIRFHCEGLKNTLVETVNRRMEETAARRVERRRRELEAGVAGAKTSELEEAVAGYKAEVERLRRGVKVGKRMREEMRVMLSEATRLAERVESDGESSFVGPGSTKAALVSCSGCRRRMASVIVMPCRHMSVCARCEPATAVCPICGGQRESVVKVQLPPK